jgi:hypothetical protein
MCKYVIIGELCALAPMQYILVVFAVNSVLGII